MEPVWKGVAKYNNLTAQQLGAAEIVALNRFICGLNSSEIGQLNIDAFKFVLHTELTLYPINLSYQLMQRGCSLTKAQSN